MSGFGDDIAKALMSAGKELHADKKRRDRDAVNAARHRRHRFSTRDITLKEAVFNAMERAVAAASGNGAYPVDPRSIYYQIRPLIQKHTNLELTGKYFSQTLLVEYQQIYGPIAGLYREARGALHEPHTGVVVPLGTREVAGYQLPDHVFDKILYVEKESAAIVATLKGIAPRYDLAIASGKGQPVEAVRALFERAEAGDYRLFVLHDADDAGYSIARAMAEETKRMPGYQVDVVDLGLTVADAIRLDLSTETYTRRKALPWWMPSRLTDVEQEWFQGEQSYYRPPQWQCTRVELNALTAPDLVAYVEAGLAANGADGKLVPPDDAIHDKAVSAHRDAVQAWVDEEMARRYDIDSIVNTLVAETTDTVIDNPATWVTDAYEEDQATYWRTAITDEVDGRLGDLNDQMQTRLTALLAAPGDPE